MYSRIEANEEHDNNDYRPLALTSRDHFGAKMPVADSSNTLSDLVNQAGNTTTPRKKTPLLNSNNGIQYPGGEFNLGDSESNEDSFDEFGQSFDDEDDEDGDTDDFENLNPQGQGLTSRQNSTKNLQDLCPSSSSSSFSSIQQSQSTPSALVQSLTSLQPPDSFQLPPLHHSQLHLSFSNPLVPPPPQQTPYSENPTGLAPDTLAAQTEHDKNLHFKNLDLGEPMQPNPQPSLQTQILLQKSELQPSHQTSLHRTHPSNRLDITSQEFLHHHQDRFSNVQNILTAKPTPTYLSRTATDRDRTKTAIEIAIEEVRTGIEAIDNRTPKPIPTFTRAHFNTNWITENFNATNSHRHRSKHGADKRQEQLREQYKGDHIMRTFYSPDQQREEFDDTYDVEKNQVSIQFLNCLKLRREFLFTPAFVDRRRFDVMDRAAPYEPCLDGVTVNRPAFDALTTTTKLQQTVAVLPGNGTTVITPLQGTNGLNIVNDPHKPNLPTLPISQVDSDDPQDGRASMSQISGTGTSNSIASPRACRPTNSPMAANSRSNLNSTNWTPSHSRSQSINPHQQQQQQQQPTQLVTTTITTIDPQVFQHIDPYLSADLINNPHNFNYGFVNGVMHVYRREAADLAQHQRQLRQQRKEKLAAQNTPETIPLDLTQIDLTQLTAVQRRQIKATQKLNQQHEKAKALDAKNKATGIKYEAQYSGYTHDIYHLAIHQHHVHQLYHQQLSHGVLSPQESVLSASDERSDERSNDSNDELNKRFSTYHEEYDNLVAVPSWNDFCDALTYILQTASNGPCKSWAYQRLTMLDTQKTLHTQLNQDLERAQSKAVPHRDFYNVRKIDNHVHHSACMNQKHLLRFIKRKLREPESTTFPVITRDGHNLTLEQVFKSLNLTAYDLSIDTLDMHASQTFHRFDKFNAKYSPIQETRLREIFLKYNNKIKGQYLAEITREVFEDLTTNKYQFAEYRVSIYGKEINEWDALAEWIIDYKLVSPNVRWMIQIPRLYKMYKMNNSIDSFQDMLTNIFLPIFHCTLFPNQNPKLHQLLTLIVGFDTVDDESVRTRFFDKTNQPPPQKWTIDEDPNYCVFLYYLYANLRALNQLRELVGLNTFALRPHAGEAGDEANVAAAFLTSKGINHGLTLHRTPPIQYMYYLAQVGISMSPLSNNLLFLEYQKNPFPKFFNRGLNVTLSTDDPLMIHVTKEPLIEEYSIASQVWGLSHLDLCEIAKNSVLQSGFEHQYKVHWIGNGYHLHAGTESNDIRASNLPDIRAQYRWEVLYREHLLLSTYAYHNDDVDVDLIDPQY
jgi:AMP deaminase